MPQTSAGDPRIAAHILWLTVTLAWAGALIGLLAGWPIWEPGLFAYDGKRVIQIGTVLLWLLLPLGFSPLRNGLLWLLFQQLPRWAGLALLSFFALGLISSLQSSHLGPALAELSNLYALGLTGAGTALLFQASEKLAPLLVLSALLGSMAYFLSDFLAFYAFNTLYLGVPIEWSSPFFGFANVRFFSQYQTWTLPLLPLITLTAFRHNGLLGALVAMVGSGWWSLQLATGTRGTWLAMALSTLFVLLVFKRGARSWIAAQCALVFTGLLMFLLLFWGHAPGLERVAEASARVDSMRIRLWLQALVTTWANPLLGIGPMHLNDGLQVKLVGHPHNSALQIMAEWGIPAVLSAAIFLMGGLAAFIRRFGTREWGPPAKDPLLPVSLLAALIAGLVHSMISGVIIMPASQLLAVLIIGWSGGVYLQSNGGGFPVHQPQSRPARIGGWSLAGVGALVATVLAFQVVPHIARLETAERSYLEAEGQFAPRFWLQGRLNFPPWTEHRRRTALSKP